jgi:hypothetical protein
MFELASGCLAIDSMACAAILACPNVVNAPLKSANAAAMCAADMIVAKPCSILCFLQLD